LGLQLVPRPWPLLPSSFSVWLSRPNLAEPGRMLDTLTLRAYLHRK
jgi:hypothetical protein